MTRRTPASTAAYTLMGVGAVVLWSTIPAVARPLMESVGCFAAGAAVFGLGGLWSGVAFPRWFAAGDRTPPGKQAVLALLFASYLLCVYCMLGFASSRAEMMIGNMLNQTWPVSALVMSLAFGPVRVRWFFPLGALLALAGAALALFSRDPGALSGGGSGAWGLPFTLAALSSILWGLYSNLARHWREQPRTLPWNMLAVGAGFAAIAGDDLAALRDPARWPPILYLAAVSGAGFLLWNRGMRHGDARLCIIASYFLPLLSAAFVGLALGVGWNSLLLFAALLIAAGAVLCRQAIRS